MRIPYGPAAVTGDEILIMQLCMLASMCNCVATVAFEAMGRYRIEDEPGVRRPASVLLLLIFFEGKKGKKDLQKASDTSKQIRGFFVIVRISNSVLYFS